MLRAKKHGFLGFSDWAHGVEDVLMQASWFELFRVYFQEAV